MSEALKKMAINWETGLSRNGYFIHVTVVRDARRYRERAGEDGRIAEKHHRSLYPSRRRHRIHKRRGLSKEPKRSVRVACSVKVLRGRTMTETRERDRKREWGKNERRERWEEREKERKRERERDREKETEKEVSSYRKTRRFSQKMSKRYRADLLAHVPTHTLCSSAEAEENRTEVSIDSLGRTSSRNDITDTVTRRATQNHITSASIVRVVVPKVMSAAGVSRKLGGKKSRATNETRRWLVLRDWNVPGDSGVLR